MKVLGIETSCDECAAAVVEDGKTILSNVIATQIPFHAEYNGVVPEIASRMHTEWIDRVAQEALDKASLKAADIDAVAAAAHPGLLGSLLVGVSFGKAFAWAQGIPFIAVDHMLAHLYAPRFVYADLAYPFLGLLVSGGHTIICRADDFDDITVLGATIDDAVGEAFDKVSKHYGFGYPGGAIIDKLAKTGNMNAFNFPMPRLQHKGRLRKTERNGKSGGIQKDEHRYDVSYSGLKTAAVNQLDLFRAGPLPVDGDKPQDIAASFQKTAVEILLRGLLNAAEDTGLTTIVSGGGVAANSYLREKLAEQHGLRCLFPPLDLCGDNGAMIAGLAYQYLARGESSPLTATASARVKSFKRSLV